MKLSAFIASGFATLALAQWQSGITGKLSGVGGTYQSTTYDVPADSKDPFANLPPDDSPYNSPYGGSSPPPAYGGSSPPYQAPNPPYRPNNPPYRPPPFGGPGGGRLPGGSNSEYSFSGARCGVVNGACNANDCLGTQQGVGWFCTSGNWDGCPCGFDCGPTNGLCRDGGCNGVASGRKPGDGVCRDNFRGCSCNLW